LQDIKRFFARPDRRGSNWDVKNKIAPPSIAERKDALAATSDRLIRTIDIAGNLDQIRQDIWHVARESAANVDNLEVNIRFSATKVQPQDLVFLGMPRYRNPTAEDDVVSLPHPLLLFLARH
jgi:hypothetical protein